MAKLENRFIRIEDWKGNRYYPDSNSDTNTAGIIFKEAGTDPDSDPWTQARLNTDEPNANGRRALEITPNGSNLTLFQCTVPTMPFGKIVIGPRLKVSGASVIGTDTTILNLQTYFRDLRNPDSPVDTPLDNYAITGKKFTADMYSVIPRSVDYKGTAIDHTLLIKLIVPASLTSSATITFDQMYVAMEIGLSSEITSQNIQGRTLILA